MQRSYRCIDHHCCVDCQAEVFTRRPPMSKDELRSLATRNMQAAAVVAAAGGAKPRLSSLLVEESWKLTLEKELAKPSFSKGLQGFLEGEWSRGAKVFPPKDSIFRAMNSCPMDQVSGRERPAGWLRHASCCVYLEVLFVRGSGLARSGGLDQASSGAKSAICRPPSTTTATTFNPRHHYGRPSLAHLLLDVLLTAACHFSCAPNLAGKGGHPGA